GWPTACCPWDRWRRRSTTASGMAEPRPPAGSKDDEMPLSTAEFDYVRTLLRQSAAIDLDADKAYRADTSLLPLARQEGCATVNELVALLRATPVNGLHHKAVEAMTVNETSFFR